MNREEELCDVQTPTFVIAPSILFGAVGALYFGYLALSANVGLMDSVIVMLTGASTGASLVGLFWLLCGADLGRGFSCAFTTCFSCLTAVIVGVSLHVYGSVEGKLITETAFVWIILLGVVGGVFLTKNASGYRGRSRLWATIGLAILLVNGMIGWFIVPTKPDERIDFVVLAIAVGILALLGGVSGAVGGAICDNLARRRAARGRRRI